MPDFKRIKTITSYNGHARFLAECDWDDDEDMVEVGYIAQCQRAEIPSPYRYSPVTAIYRWNGKNVIVSEVAHRRYEVYQVAPQVKMFPTDEAASDYNYRMDRRSAA